MAEFVVYLQPGAPPRMIHDDAAAPLVSEVGLGRVFRASRVEPTPGGRWEADLAPVGGPVLGPFPARADALAAEAAWLHDRLSRGTIPCPSPTT